MFGKNWLKVNEKAVFFQRRTKKTTLRSNEWMTMYCELLQEKTIHKKITNFEKKNGRQKAANYELRCLKIEQVFFLCILWYEWRFVNFFSSIPIFFAECLHWKEQLTSSDYVWPSDTAYVCEGVLCFWVPMCICVISDLVGGGGVASVWVSYGFMGIWSVGGSYAIPFPPITRSPPVKILQYDNKFILFYFSVIVCCVQSKKKKTQNLTQNLNFEFYCHLIWGGQNFE